MTGLRTMTISRKSSFPSARSTGCALVQRWRGHSYPSRAYEEGGIHEAIADYEDAVFYDILAEELARRDMSAEQISQDDAEELNARMEEYFAEFEKHGIENVKVEA